MPAERISLLAGPSRELLNDPKVQTAYLGI